MKKILHIITGLSLGGAERVLVRLAISDKHNQHIIIALTDQFSEVITNPLKENNISFTLLHFQKHPFKSFIRLKNLIQECAPDIVQTWMYHANLIGGIAAKLAGVKNIYWNIRNGALNYGGGENDKNARLPVLSKIGWVVRLGAWACGWIPKKIVINSVRAKEIHLNWGYANKFHIIENGINIRDFYPNREQRGIFRAQYKLNETDFVVGFLGRNHPQKGIETLINVVKSYFQNGRSAKFIICGKGFTSHKGIQYLIAKYPDQVISCEYEESLKFMNGIDVLLMTSIAESFPNVVMEAMACGTPCVVTDVGDAGKIVDHYGIICAINNTYQLVQALIKIMDRNIDRQVISQSISQRFTIEQMIAKYYALYEN